MKKAIIVGASSGIGRSLAFLLAKDGYFVGLAARRLELLEKLQHELGCQSMVKQLDLSDAEGAKACILALIEEMGGTDLVVISAGTGFINPELEWSKESETIEVNVAGFTAIANAAIHHFISKGEGHLVGISSLAAIRGSGAAPAYNASKAFVSNYLDGLRQKTAKLKLPIAITDIQPGFVDTAMAKGAGVFWAASPEKAARQIFQAIKTRKKRAYITKRWRLVAWLLKLLPDSIYYRL